MKHFLSKATVTLALLCTGFCAGTHAADLDAGKKSYAVCQACHGANAEGSKAMNGPNLANQNPAYLKRQLEAFKKGWRGKAPGDTFGAQMAGMAMTLPDEAAIDNVVAYIDSLPNAPVAETLSGGDAKAGKSRYTVCGACHGGKAEGNETMKAPALAGIDDWYLLRQFNHFKQGLRGANPADTLGMQMKQMAGTLSDEQQIKDVLTYIHSLQSTE